MKGGQIYQMTFRDFTKGRWEESIRKTGKIGREGEFLLFFVFMSG